jgi:O-antigen ligase
MAGREEIYAAAMDMIAVRPLLGWGPVRNLYELGPRVGWERRDTHNLYLWLLTEAGFIGSAPAFAGLALCMRHAWQARKSVDGVLPLAILVTLLTINLAATFHLLKWFWIVLAFSCASGIEVTGTRRGVGMKRVAAHARMASVALNGSGGG